jgi:phage-related protein/predicted XRE-type DNA-binding protein
MNGPLIWLHGEVRMPPLSARARTKIGILLRQLQLGETLDMQHSRPMPSIGPRCHELRIPDGGVNWRLIYRIDTDAVVVLEVFGKKTEETPHALLEACKERLRRYDTIADDEERGKVKAAKRARLEAAGWAVGDVAEFLGLSPEEVAFIELKLALARHLRETRTRNAWTQTEIAVRLGTSQSRVAKMEAADDSVSVDLLVMSLLALGVSRSEVGQVIGAKAA